MCFLLRDRPVLDIFSNKAQREERALQSAMRFVPGWSYPCNPKAGFVGELRHPEGRRINSIKASEYGYSRMDRKRHPIGMGPGGASRAIFAIE